MNEIIIKLFAVYWRKGHCKPRVQAFMSNAPGAFGLKIKGQGGVS